MGFKDDDGKWGNAGIQYKDDDTLRIWRLDHVEQWGTALRTQTFHDMVTRAFAKGIYYNQPWIRPTGDDAVPITVEIER